jgi:hypothetical protein
MLLFYFALLCNCTFAVSSALSVLMLCVKEGKLIQFLACACIAEFKLTRSVNEMLH